MEEMKRAKIQVRNQLKEERSSNYWLGVDRRIVEFPKYLISNKRILLRKHKYNNIVRMYGIT